MPFPRDDEQTEIMVWPDASVTTPPSPTPTTTGTPAPAVQPPVAPEGDLVTVGLLPRARGTGDEVLAYYAKVGWMVRSRKNGGTGEWVPCQTLVLASSLLSSTYRLG